MAPVIPARAVAVYQQSPRDLHTASKSRIRRSGTISSIKNSCEPTSGSPIERSTMSKFIATTAAFGAAAAALGLAGTAAAFPQGGTAADTAATLSAEGYRVAFNGSVSAPLSECAVTGTHPSLDAAATRAEKENTTVFIDVSCPSKD
jgi:hypothetical protein